MTMYGRIRTAEESRGLDRKQWANLTNIVIAYETKGVGTKTTELMDFGITFEGPPFFTYGVELAEGEILIEGDYPLVSAGVAEWVTAEPQQEDAEFRESKMLHTGAYVALNVQTNKSYRLVFRMTFQGVAFKNPQYLR